MIKRQEEEQKKLEKEENERKKKEMEEKEALQLDLSEMIKQFKDSKSVDEQGLDRTNLQLSSDLLSQGGTHIELEEADDLLA